VSNETESSRQQREQHARKNERAQWAQLYRIYERCVEITEKVWSARLDAAQEVQQDLAEEMRDRLRFDNKDGRVLVHEGVIPVPLFTPRDRLQFLKECAATLLISADRRSLTVLFPKEEPDAAPQPPEGEVTAVEAASGTDEGSLDGEATDLAEAGERAPLSL